MNFNKTADSYLKQICKAIESNILKCEICGEQLTLFDARDVIMVESRTLSGKEKMYYHKNCIYHQR